jgi:hypothetical protein
VRRSFARLAVAGIVAVALTGCSMFGTSGQGAVSSETRQVRAFTGIDVDAGIGLTVQIGPTQAVEVRAQQNILPLISTVVQGDQLTIRSTQSYNTSEGVMVTVTAPALDGVSESGGSQGTVGALAAASFTVKLNGGARLTAAGTATSVSVTANGGATADLSGLAAKTVTVDLNGGGTVTVDATETVDGSASGGAHLTVLGGAKVNVQTSGGASVTSQ